MSGGIIVIVVEVGVSGLREEKVLEVGTVDTGSEERKRGKRGAEGAEVVICVVMGRGLKPSDRACWRASVRVRPCLKRRAVTSVSKR